ncbi:recombinase family protein [Sandaracinobacter sp. RS1-74]|uniref:recombinase family protein n=1 Tax=Sandaracinobacteroides sayramensis TaxID=2913411 RepID=UPI001EDBECCA|nr:recombinase family protein [Sandaracinobacteroides sayramensis]MCG2842283.1 recombinase family protein [Sandaracinobacteroides sayramensis]
MNVARPAPRVALYARYSSDNQRDASIEDQLRQCRERAAREGWTIVESYSDRAISGASLIRPGIQSVLADAQAGRFDILLSEALDRISRDQEDVAGAFKRLRFAGVTIFTLSEGEISELHVGLKGTMNALFLKDLAIKTHRGIRGRVEAGKIGGGNSFGYRVAHQLDARGEPIRGERTIIEEQAEIVRRIFREYVAGKGPQRIAADLNRDGIPSPTGKRWGDTVIRGNRVLGSGILNCELYVGRLVWNRQRKVKNPDTGRYAYRLNPKSEWVFGEAPELRIIPQELWDAAKARQDQLTGLYERQIDHSRAAMREMMAKNGGLNATHRPRTMLSGLVFCGCCGGTYRRRGHDRYTCTNHALGNGCDNARTVPREALEARVLTGLREHMMTPEMAAEAMRVYAEETNRLNRERRITAETTRRELADTAKAIAEIVRVIEQGGWHRALSDRLTELEAKQDSLTTARLSDTPQDVPDIHPGIAETFRRRIERLTAALDHPDDALEAADAIREVIDRIVITPGKRRGSYSVTLQGELGAILDWIERTGKPGYTPDPDIASSRLSTPVKTWASSGCANGKRLRGEPAARNAPARGGSRAEAS